MEKQNARRYEKNPRITPKVEKEICDLITLMAARSKNGKVNMTEIAKLADFSRPALYGNDAIKKTYYVVNDKQSSVVTAEKKVTELEAKLIKTRAENKRLKVTLREYDAKYNRWLYNATNANLSIDELNALVPESVKTAGRKKSR
jgi:predicted DNA-binding protein YlxM (UPF0122 family)